MMKYMSAVERKATFGLSLIYAFRMLGLFMILPVFSLYAEHLQGSTPFLVGLTVGIYGLSQVCLQIPFGWISDKIGRKPVIIVGLLLFALGSMIAGFSESIYGVFLGRAIQGAGAISSATMALLGDVTQEENRTKAMASIGMTMGLSFALSIVLGPFLNQYIGVSGLFFFTAGLALLGIILLITLVPIKSAWVVHHDTEISLKEIPSILLNTSLLQLNFGIFVQHAVLTSTFIVIPLLLSHLNISMGHEWKLTLLIIASAFVFSIPIIVIAEVKKKIKFIFITSVFLLMFSQWAFWFLSENILNIVIFLWIFFMAFSALEALLPSLVSKIAPAGLRGTAMGLYASSQFFGIFIGGVLAGFISQHYAIKYVVLANAVLLFVWLWVAFFMKAPRYLSTLIFPLSFPYISREHCLAIEGVIDAAVCPDEGVIYLKIDKDRCDMARLQSRLYSQYI